MKHYTLLFLIVLSSCSKNVFTYQQPKKTITFSVSGETPSLTFLTTSNNQNDEHNKIYLRFKNVFGDTKKFPIKSISPNEIVEYLNDTTIYYNNKSAKQQGLILSNGKKSPVIEYDPKNYITTYENYFGIRFNDKTYYQEKAKNIKSTNEKLVKEILETKFKITAAYAKSLIKNSSTAHYTTVKKKKYICNTGTVHAYHYTDSLKTKKADLTITTKYNENNQYEKEIRNYTTGYHDETNYYYNNFGLIDSITKTITSQGETERNVYFYIYRKNEYFTLEKSKKNIALTARYLLNNKLQCVKMQSYNSYSADYEETEYKYDLYGRLIETSHDDEIGVYKYEKPDSEIYSDYLSFTGGKQNNFKNKIERKGAFIYYLSEIEGKTILSSKSRVDKNDCLYKSYNYDLDKKLVGYYEYKYE